MEWLRLTVGHIAFMTRLGTETKSEDIDSMTKSQCR